MERPSWLCLKVLRWFHFLKSRQRNVKNLLSSGQLLKCAKRNSQILEFNFVFHYDINLKHTFSQILQQDQFSTLTKTKIKLQAVKYCLFQPSPLTPQCPLNSNLLTSCPHNPAPGPSKHPQFFRTNHNSKKSYLHLSIKEEVHQGAAEVFLYK